MRRGCNGVIPTVVRERERERERERVVVLYLPVVYEREKRVQWRYAYPLLVREEEGRKCFI